MGITKSQCMAAASKIFTDGLLEMLGSDPAEAAKRAYMRGGPTVEELEMRIIRWQNGDRT